MIFLRTFLMAVVSLLLIHGARIFCADRKAGPADGEKAFLQIAPQARVIHYSGSLPDGIQGGHLQGVQWLKRSLRDYFLVTGSSDSCSYYAIIQPGADRQVRVHRLLDTPWKHAGGFQINGKWMAVGIEDNEDKNRSKVHVYPFSDPEKIPVRPVAEIERTGPPYRSTAGCVAITEWRHRLVLIVGDWDSRHLDLYVGDLQSWEKGTVHLDSAAVIDTATIDKSGWIDSRWLPYQNINLFTDQQDRLFLVGMGVDENKKDRADLFAMETSNFSDFTLLKKAGREFFCREGASFRLGSGLFVTENGSLGVVACSEAIGEASTLNLFLPELGK